MVYYLVQITFLFSFLMFKYEPCLLKNTSLSNQSDCSILDYNVIKTPNEVQVLYLSVLLLYYVYFPSFVSPCRVGSVGSVSASRTVHREFASRPGHTKGHHKNRTNCLPAWRAMR